ncbi:MAG: hypothetical protein HZA49_08665 [Planctomycetes bacterium]|nr:hypothetical protein [Planctomycetota bacterium]
MNPDGTIDWIYVFATLGIRFVGVFIILGVLQLGLTITSKIVGMIISAKQSANPALK